MLLYNQRKGKYNKIKKLLRTGLINFQGKGLPQVINMVEREGSTIFDRYGKKHGSRIQQHLIYPDSAKNCISPVWFDALNSFLFLIAPPENRHC